MKTLRRFLFIVLLSGCCPIAATGQTSGSVRGLVTDMRGDPLAGVSIAISSKEQAVTERGAVTGADGTFRLSFLPAARDYQVRAFFPGLATVIMSDVVVSAGEIVKLRLVMQPESELQVRVEVRARPQIVDLESTTTETTLSAEFMDALPILGRNYQDVLSLAPGVTDVDGDGNPNIHGARDTDVNTLVDGVSTTDPLTGKVGAQLNIESIQEIEVKTSGATAEFSRAQGGFANIITKSGGNQFQGTFKFFWRGSLLDRDGAGIDDPLLRGGVGEVGLRDLDFNDFLPFLSVGGPIVKDKAWFFATLEYIQREDPVNTLNQAFVAGLREHREFAKATWQVSPNHRLALSLNYDPQEFLNQGINSFTRQESGFTLEQGGLMVTLKGVSVLSPTVALETTIAHFDGRPALLPNLGPDTNGNGILYFDRNKNGFAEPDERDPGEDYDGDGLYDVFEDIDGDGVIDTWEIEDPPDSGITYEFTEDLDGDGILTPSGACEGALREDTDCDGFLDQYNEDLNGNGILDRGEDIDGDKRLDLGTEDRNGNGLLDDTPFPSGGYPYGRLSPESPDRDYTFHQNSGIVRGPYFEDFSDRRGRITFRQDLSLFVPDRGGSHDLKLGIVLERESFDRRAAATDILADRDAIPPTCFIEEDPLDPDAPPEETCYGGLPPSVITLLPVERQLDAEATGRTGGLFVQDHYKPRSNLSFGLGLRFDREAVDTSGYTYFDPALQAEGSERIVSLTGGERNGGDFGVGNSDGITSLGIQSDPLFAGGASVEETAAFIVDPARIAALSRLTRHRSTLAFTLSHLGALFPDIIQGGQLDTELLAKLGVSFQQPEAFSITNNNLAPRLSLSWDPWSDGRTKLFATWGRYYDKLFLNTIVGERAPERLARYYVKDTTGLDVLTLPYSNIAVRVTPNHHIGQLISEAPPSITQVDRRLQTPYSDEFTLGFEREVAPEVALSVRYINRQYRKQLQDIDVNHSLHYDPRTGEPIDLIGRNLPTLTGVEVRVPDGRPDLYIHNFFFNQVLRVGNFNEARYRAIELEIRKRSSRRWELQGSYTYSRALGDAEDFQSRLGNDPSTVESEFGYLDYDQRHVIKLNATAFLPADWQIGVAATWSSGLPYSVITRFFALDNADYQQFRTRFGFTERVEDSYQFQRMRRNSERNGAVYDLNLRAKKSFVIGRTAAAAFLEVFNVLNTDDIRIFTFEPSKSEVFVPGDFSAASSPLQIDATRRFGRRFQLGIQLSF